MKALHETLPRPRDAKNINQKEIEMEFHEAVEAINGAQQTIRNSNYLLRQVASLLRNRLRSAGIGVGDLVELKKELRDFNMTTCTWKTK